MTEDLETRVAELERRVAQLEADREAVLEEINEKLGSISTDIRIRGGEEASVLRDLVGLVIDIGKRLER